MKRFRCQQVTSQITQALPLCHTRQLSVQLVITAPQVAMPPYPAQLVSSEETFLARMLTVVVPALQALTVILSALPPQLLVQLVTSAPKVRIKRRLVLEAPIMVEQVYMIPEVVQVAPLDIIAHSWVKSPTTP